LISKDFIAACKRLKDLDLSAPNAVVLDAAVTKAMPPRYEMPYRSSERKTFERRTNPPARNRQGQWHELVQHLHDLHYISEAFFVAWHKRRAADKPPLHPQLEHIYAGISIYLGEDDYSLYKELAPFPAKTFTDRTE